MAEGALSGFATGFGRGLARTGELSLEKKIREDIEKLKLEQEEARQQNRQLQDLKSFGDFFGVPGDPTIDPTAYRKNLTEAAAKKDYTIEFGSGGSVKITQMSPKDKILRDMTPEQQVIAAGGVQPPTMASVYEQLLNPPPIPPGRTMPISGGGVFPTVEAAPSVVPTEPPGLRPKVPVPQQFVGSSLSTPNIPARPGITGKIMDVADTFTLAVFDAAKKVLPEGWANSFTEWAVSNPERFRQLRGKELGLPVEEFMARLRERGAPTDKIAIAVYEEYGGEESGKFPFRQAGPMRKGDIPEAFNSLGTPPKFF